MKGKNMTNTKYNIPRTVFNNIVLDATRKAQQKYGFEIGTGEHATWNNEADAFKHAYMQWFLGFFFNDSIAKEYGDMHENETPNAPSGERNMDLWNNAIGREIALDMRKKYTSVINFNNESISDIASEIIYNKMKNGELITDPSDPRRFENMKYERIKDKDKVFFKGEYDTLSEEDQEKFLKQYSRQLVDNGWKIQTKEELDRQVLSGDLIYVNNYTKADGTKVSGYYRHKKGMKNNENFKRIFR